MQNKKYKNEKFKNWDIDRLAFWCNDFPYTQKWAIGLGILFFFINGGEAVIVACIIYLLYGWSIEQKAREELRYRFKHQWDEPGSFEKYLEEYRKKEAEKEHNANRRFK